MSVSSGDGQDVRRLVAIAGMLGSDHDGERANAARLATIELRRLGLTWSDLVQRAFRQITVDPPRPSFRAGFQQAPPQETRPPRQENRRASRKNGLNLWEFVRFASLHGARLNAWENRFVESFLELGPKATASERQWQVLLDIAAKLGTRAA